MTEYESDVKLGDRYVDTQTGFAGVATTVTFFQHACERVGVEAYDAERREVKVEVFDAPRLVNELTAERAKSDRPGGPLMPNAQRGPLGR